jgi:hypothetical protein
MIESFEIAAMKREKDETLPDSCLSDRIGYGLLTMKREKDEMLPYQSLTIFNRFGGLLTGLQAEISRFFKSKTLA